MARISRIAWLAIAAVAIVATVAQMAAAQREEGRRGRGGPGGPGGRGPVNAVRLAAESDEVQAALQIKEEQKEEITEINKGLREKGREAMGESGGDFRAMRGKMEELLGEATSEMKEVLSDEQEKQLAGVTIKVNDAGALGDPLVAAELELTDEQKAKLAELRDSQMREMREQFRGDGGKGERPSREEMEERRAKMEERRAESQKAFLAVLTSEQQSEFESLKNGAPDIDASELRGRGGPDGARGDRDRGDRKRGDRKRGDRPKRDRDRDRDTESPSDAAPEST